MLEQALHELSPYLAVPIMRAASGGLKATQTRKRQVWARGALGWIQADDWSWPFSFLNICSSLEIAQYLRQELFREGVPFSKAAA